MTRSTRQRLATTLLAGAAALLAAAPASAGAPSSETMTVHRESPFVQCPGFDTVGVWDIRHTLTLFFNADGVATRDIEAVDFTGRIVNPTTGAWVPDSGSRKYFDTLAPDGSFLTTYSVEVRKSRYVHQAGRMDYQTGELRGLDGFTPGNTAALCEALGG